ncbi:T9SS type A sorting domain-containing protein [Pinibacter aurantiacus]|uniref:T9SS type A sorting domain-containing protein n=1 Tax=Pinibacter aurantiacus TaxID=2851599 RepID=A0A9E2SCP2_9BACT|nr:hypothetical protein [Pinibacter aurantiacus]MBV4357460.1 hypothetical protein [Pinibacter aurantiacus]
MRSQARRRLVLFVAFLFLFLGNSWAQFFTISYPVSAENITRAMGQSKVTVKVVFNASSCVGTTVKISLPVSVSYVPGTITKTGGTAALGISEKNISDLRSPVFDITGTPVLGNEITFTLSRNASCGADAPGKDSVYVFSSCGDASDLVPENGTYNLLSPALSIAPPVSINNAYLGKTDMRSFTVTNGGNGCGDTLRLYVIYPAAGIVNTNSNQLSVGGMNFSPWRSNGDTLFYKIFGASLFGGDNLFCNGESVAFNEPVKVVKCNAATTYGIYWGNTPDPGSACQLAETFGTVTMASGSPNFSQPSGNTVRTSFTSECDSAAYRVTFTNGGTGEIHAATMYNVKVEYTLYDWENYSAYQGGALGNFSINGKGVNYSSPNWQDGATYVDLKDQLTADPDGPGVGLEDMDGDGFYDDLPPGQVLTLDFKMKYNGAERFACNTDKHRQWNNVLFYNNMCDPEGAALTKSTWAYGPTEVDEEGFGSLSRLPVNIVGDVPFRFTFNAQWAKNDNINFGVNGRYQYRMILPAGVSVVGTGNPTYGTTNVTYTISGDTIIITSPDNKFDSAGIDLVYKCGPSVNLSFWHGLRKINDYVNYPYCYPGGDKFCTTISGFGHCPPAICVNGGAVTYLPVIRRVDGSLGWTDYTLTQRQSATNISSYDLSKALYLDTIQIIGSALQHDNFDNVHVMLELDKTTISPIGQNKLIPLDMHVEVWRAGAKVSDCVVSNSSDSSTTASQRIDWNLCLPIGGIKEGDSIYTVSRYIVAVNEGLPQHDVQSGNSWHFYNKDAGGAPHSCTEAWVPEMYLVGTAIGESVNTLASPVCGEFSTGDGIFSPIGRRFDATGTNYANEFRPMAFIDSIVLIVPQGYDYKSANLEKFASAGSPSVTTALTPNVVNGKNYTFVNPGNWPFFEVGKMPNYGGSFVPTIASNCQVTTLEEIQVKVYVKDYYYAFGNVASVPSAYKYLLDPGSSADLAKDNDPAGGYKMNINYNATQRPNLVIQNQTGTVQGVATQQSWDIKISNTGQTTANNLWLAFEKGNGKGGISIDSVVFVQTHAKPTGLGAYSAPGITGYNWYKLSDAGIASGSETVLRVYFKYSSCTKDSILMKAGWSCSGYPSPNPTNYQCSVSQGYLTVDPLPSQIQVNVLRQPGDNASINLCSQDSVLLVVNSAQGANLINPYLTFHTPFGFNVSLPVEVEYPYGSGDYQNAKVTQQADGSYKIDLNGHSVINQTGLLGTLQAQSTELRQAKVKIKYSVDCSFASGSPLFLQFYGSLPCGNNSIGNGSIAATNGIYINGATAVGRAGGSFIPGGSSTLKMGERLTLDLSVTPTSVGTQPKDSVVYLLPAGLGYVEGSFAPGGNCGNCTISVNGNALIVALPVGVAAGTPINYSIDVEPQAQGCGTVNINGLFKREASPLSCGETSCSSTRVVIGQFSSGDIVIEKPTFVLSNFDFAPAVIVPGSNTKTYNLTITNTSDVDAPENSYVVNIYCGSNNNGKLLYSFTTSAIPANSSVLEAGSFSFTSPLDCGAGLGLYAEMQDTTKTGTPALLCNKPSGLASLTVLPVKIVSFSGQHKGDNNLLQWVATNEVNLYSYEIQYSSNGRDFNNVGIVYPVKGGSGDRKNYSYLHENVKGNAWYRLKVIDIDGKIGHSNVIYITVKQSGGNLNAVGNGLYPVPFSNRLYVNLYSNVSKKAVIKIVNSIGITVKEVEVVLREGSSVYILESLDNLPSGTYSVFVITDSDKLVMKSMK